MNTKKMYCVQNKHGVLFCLSTLKNQAQDECAQNMGLPWKECAKMGMKIVKVEVTVVGEAKR